MQLFNIIDILRSKGIIGSYRMFSEGLFNILRFLKTFPIIYVQDYLEAVWIFL